MDRKGQMNVMGIVLVAFIGVIASLAMYQAVVQTVGSSTTTVSVINSSITAPAIDTRIDIAGQDLISVQNVATNGTLDLGANGGNYTIDEVVSETTGVLTVSFRTDNATYAGRLVNLTYVQGPDGYIESSGARSVAGLIAVFAALAIAVVALVPTLRNNVLQMMKR